VPLADRLRRPKQARSSPPPSFDTTLATRTSPGQFPHRDGGCDTQEIPENGSGKILRRPLRARFLGHDVGDVSTLDTRSASTKEEGSSQE
jgi:hypothetical protein